MGHKKVARVRSIAQIQTLIQANNMRSRMTSGGGGGREMETARLLTNCSNTLHNIHTNAREKSQEHVQNGRRATFSWPTLYILNVCVSSLIYPACKGACFVLYCHPWPVWFYNIFPSYLIKGMIFGKGY